MKRNIIFLIGALLIVSVWAYAAQQTVPAGDGAITVGTVRGYINDNFTELYGKWTSLGATHDTSAELDALYEGELDNEAGLYSALSDVTDFVQPGDALDVNGNAVVLDADGDTDITSASDDVISFNIGGESLIEFTGNGVSTSGAVFEYYGSLFQDSTNLSATNESHFGLETSGTLAGEQTSVMNIFASGAQTGANSAVLQLHSQSTSSTNGYVLRLESEDPQVGLIHGEDVSETEVFKVGYDGGVTSAGAVQGSTVTDGTVTLGGDGTITGISAGGLPAGIIEADELEATNALTDNYIPSYDLASGGFTWVENAAGGTDDQIASEVDVTTTNFAGIFSNDASHDTVQEVLDVVDDIDADDLGDGSTNAIITLAQETSFAAKYGPGDETTMKNALDDETWTFTETVTAPRFESSGADGTHSLDVTNSVAITATATDGHVAGYNGDNYQADGTDWDDKILTEENTATVENKDLTAGTNTFPSSLATDSELTTHEGAADPHTVYVLESAAGTAHTRDAEDTLTNGANLPDGAAIITYGNANWGGGSGDSVSIDSVSVTDPDFVSTGDIDFVDTSNTVTANLNADVVAAAEMADADHGDISWSGGVASLDADVVDSPEIADGAVDSVHISTIVNSVPWNAAGLETDGTNCAAAEAVTLNSGPKTRTISCADTTGAYVYGNVPMPDSWDGGTVTFEMQVWHGTTETITFAGDFDAQCRGAGEIPSSTWGTAVAADVSITTANQIEHATSGAVTPAGTPCAGGDHLFWRWTLDDTTSDANAANTDILAVKMEYTSNVGDN